MLKYQLFAVRSLPHGTCLEGTELCCSCSQFPTFQLAPGSAHKLRQGKDSLCSGQNRDLNLGVSAWEEANTPTPGTNSIIHTRGIAMDHPLPSESPAVNQCQLFFCPPRRQGTTPTQTIPKQWIGRDQVQGEDPSPGLAKIRFNGSQVQTHPHLTKQDVLTLRELGLLSLERRSFGLT